MASIRYLLLHSPLVARETWIALVPRLKAAGLRTTVVGLDHSRRDGEALYEHHIAQIETATSALQGETVIAVAHSGAGSLLALLDPELIAGYVFLDAIFPTARASRFDLFDDPAAVERWRSVAEQNEGLLPCTMLARFGEQIADPDIRDVFVSGLVDVPISLFEESIPVHSGWPPATRGLYVQWTDAYSADARRADGAGFEVRVDQASHFKMLNQPDEAAGLLIDFASTYE